MCLRPPCDGHFFNDNYRKFIRQLSSISYQKIDGNSRVIDGNFRSKNQRRQALQITVS
jgi:hypothetical protein